MNQKAVSSRRGRLLRAVLTAVATAGLLTAAAPAVAMADSLSISLSNASPANGIPITVTLTSSSVTPIDSNGDGPFLYAAVQPASAGGCQPTFGDDQQVVGSQASVLEQGDRLNTGQDSQSSSFTAYTAGSYTVCGWVETKGDDWSGSGYTPSIVFATATGTLASADTDTLSASLSTNSPQPHVPFTVTFSGSATPIDSDGNGPYLYAVAQPAGAGGCQATFGDDQQVTGSQGTVLEQGDRVSTGQFSNPDSLALKPAPTPSVAGLRRRGTTGLAAATRPPS